MTLFTGEVHGCPSSGSTQGQGQTVEGKDEEDGKTTPDANRRGQC